MTAFDWIRRLPVGDRTRRVLDETLADATHERRTATSAVGSVTAMARMTGAVVRAVIALGGVFDEGYPMRNLGQDFRYGLRRLRASPAFAIFSILTLAVGIGATTAIVSAVHAVTGPPDGVRAPATLISINHAAAGNPFQRALSWSDYRDLTRQATSFERLTAFAVSRAPLVANGRSEPSFGEIVDGNYFTVLGVEPAMGRLLQPADDRPGADSVVVISDWTWRRLFDASPDVVGRSLLLAGRAFTIVGVAPESFSGLFNGGLTPSATWTSISGASYLQARYTMGDDRDQRWLQVRGRLNAGRTLAEARAELGVIAANLDRSYPLGKGLDASSRPSGSTERRWTLTRVVDEGKIGGVGDAFVTALITMILVSVALVLLVACTNLANLALARVASRQHDIAVRLSLGASRWRLTREALVEYTCIVALGGIASIGLAKILINVLSLDVDLGVGVVRARPVLDWFALMSALGATVLALLVAGLAPAIQATRADARSSLAAGGTGGALPRWRGRRWLISLQVAVSLALLSIATVMVDQARKDLRRDTGMDLDHIAAAEIDFGAQHVDDVRAQQVALTAVETLRKLPGVAASAASSQLPLGEGAPGGFVKRSDEALRYGHYEKLIASTPDLLRTLDVPIRRGRALSDQDTTGALQVAVLSEGAAKTLFDTTDVLGRQFELRIQGVVGMSEQPVVVRTVVGVAADTDTAPGDRGRPAPSTCRSHSNTGRD